MKLTNLTLKQHVFLFTMLGLFFAFTHVRLTWTDGDEGRYLALAHAVSEGLGQVEEYYPEPQPETLTPSGYVYYLGAWVKTFGLQLGIVRLSSVLPFVIFVSAFSALVWLRTRSAPWLSIPLSILGTIQIQLLRYAWNLMSETSFLALVFLAFAIQEKKNSPILIPILLGLLASLATLVRPVGLALCLAGMAFYLLQRRWKETTLFVFAFFVPYSLEIIRTWRLLGVPFAYMTHYQSDVPESHAILTAVSNLWAGWRGYFFQSLPEDLFFSLFQGRGLLDRLHLSCVSRPFMLAVSALVAAGFLRRIRRMQVAEWFWLFYWAMFCTYNAGSDPVGPNGFHFQPRYLAPVLPLAALYFAGGLDWIASLFRRLGKGALWLRDSVLFGAAFYALVTSLAVSAICVRNAWKFRGYPAWSPERVASSGNEDDLAFARYIETADWAASHLPSNAVIASRKPQHTFLFSHLKGFRYDMDWIDRDNHDPWVNSVSFGRYGPVYLLQDAFPATSGYGNTRVHVLDPAIEAHASELSLVYTTQEPITRLWLVLPTQSETNR